MINISERTSPEGVSLELGADGLVSEFDEPEVEEDSVLSLPDPDELLLDPDVLLPVDDEEWVVPELAEGRAMPTFLTLDIGSGRQLIFLTAR